MFKVGNKVRCIDNKLVKNYLTIGKIYTVDNTSESSLSVTSDQNTTDWFYNSRFELVEKEETKKKMKFVPMDELEVISVNGIDGILIPE